MTSPFVRFLPLWALVCPVLSFDIRKITDSEDEEINKSEARNDVDQSVFLMTHKIYSSGPGTALIYNQVSVGTCDQALGMESGEIPDGSITATSSYVPNVGPQNGRLRVEKAGGAWCPKQQVEKGVREYLQVDLGNIHVITGVQTQGRYDHGRGQEYMEEYTLEYWRPGFEKWKEYKRWDGKQIISGNTDTETVVSHRLMPTVYATKIRILPYSVHRRTVCLRVEIKGCLAGDGIVSYKIPEDSSVGLDLSDVSYDGERVGGFLVNGLGRLVDGEVGGDNFRLDIGYGKGNGWVGWKKTSFPKKYIETTFEFDEIRNFSAVHLFTNNFFSKEVQVFARAKIFFSLGGKFYNGRPIVYDYMPDKALEMARNVSIHLHGRVAKFVKMHLYFANKWIMLSEVTFESDVLYEGNFTEELQLDAVDDDVFAKFGNSDLSLNSLETIAERKEGQGYVEAIIGVLTALVLLLLIVFVIILLLSRRQKLQGSPTILRNPFGVTINMKDLLMNLTPSSNTGMVAVSSQPTPLGTDPQGGGSPLSFEQYRSPLVTAYNGPNYATLRSNNDDTELPVNKVGANEVKVTPPPSPINGKEGYSPPRMGYAQTPNSKPSNFPVEKSESVYSGHKDLMYATPSAQPNEYASTPQKSNTGTLTSLHYKSLQTAAVIAPRGQISPVNGFAQRSNSIDTTQRKRYHTAPREKHRIPPPVVSWNIAPSMGQTYKCKESELVPIPRYCLKITEKVGTCHAGEIILCETDGLEDIIPNCGKTVAVRTGSKDPSHIISGTTTTNSLREVRFLASLNDPNIARILGVCTAEQPPWVIFEHPDMGDLAQYLQYRTCGSSTTTQRIINNVQVLSYGCLIYMAMQISAGAKYLESKNVVHKDLAARNCLVGTNYSIKVADIAMCSPLYRKDYSEIGGRPPAPIRWLPWESILLDRYTCSSGVWSLAVTIWEVVSLARERPFQHLTNEEVIQNAEHMYYGEELKVLLPKPTLCDDELYEILCQCWKRDESERPTIKKVYNFLKAHNAGYNPSMH